MQSAPRPVAGKERCESGGKWMRVSVEEGKVEATLPDEGAVVRYPFELEDIP